MLIDRDALTDLALGAAFLGSGGGGDPYYGWLLGQAELDRCGPVELVSLDAVAEDALIVPCGWIGAPTVSVEKLPSGREAFAGLTRLEQIMGRKIGGVMPVEIGGGNGLAPLIVAARLGVPMVDGDGMGRAFPESQMVIFNIRGISACPSVITDAGGSLCVIESVDNLAHERIARAISVAMGGAAHMTEYPLTGAQARAHAIPGSVSTAIAIGAAIRTARQAGDDPFAALFTALRQASGYGAAGILFDGKIVDLERETKAGFSIGRVTIQAFNGDDVMELLFQNENLVARRNGELCAIVPDIITVMDRETADTITTERLKYGQRVKVVAAAAPVMLRDEAALAIVGPAAFGFADAYRPVETMNDWGHA